ncbi:hypothetical protein [Mucilaginibacter sp. dw_454]|uniref:hypothetical protein n=1 Tax=Mucilaginibacter sp. dw_454 TaxID=2720079 RepID=UPI001BD29742|nr:hypothetical protein [Mucilaginibacter sp. dw_454]
MIVEVFKTNVNEIEMSEQLIRQVLDHFPHSRVNFDMEDCDRILRVEATIVIPEKIIEIIEANGYLCEVLI